MIINHILPVMCDGGAMSLLEEIYLGIDKYHSNIKQNIYCLQPFRTARTTLPVSYIPGHKVPECPSLFYKLNRTETRYLAKDLPRNTFIIALTAQQDYNNLGIQRPVIAVSQNIKDQILDFEPKTNVRLIRNGVNQFRYENIPALEEPKADRCFKIGRINSFSIRKHPSDWMKYIRSLNLTRPVWHDYIGSGTKLAAAKDGSLKSRNIIKLHGEVTDFRAKISILKRLDLYVYEIVGQEGISMSLLEAQACGIPAIINNKPGNNEIIKNGINGYICNTRQDMTRIITELEADPTRLAQLKESTRNHFATLDARHMVQSYLDCLKALPVTN